MQILPDFEGISCICSYVLHFVFLMLPLQWAGILIMRCAGIINKSTELKLFKILNVPSLFCGLNRPVLHLVRGLASSTSNYFMLRFKNFEYSLIQWYLYSLGLQIFDTVIAWLYFLRSLCSRQTKIWTQDIWIWIRPLYYWANLPLSMVHNV